MRINIDQPRPVEIAILQRGPNEPGTTLRQARRRNKHVADAFVLLKVLREQNHSKKEVLTHDGATNSELDHDQMFVLWLEYTAHIALSANKDLLTKHLNDFDKKQLIRQRQICVSVLHSFGIILPGISYETPVSLNQNLPVDESV
jgi:hypothetical protein